jgi:predicted transcriptional regulator
MACINTDGSLSPIAQQILTALYSPTKLLEINQKTGVPLYRIRASIRELTDLGFMIEMDGYYHITDNGREKLEK